MVLSGKSENGWAIMVLGASITVNNSRNSGDIDSGGQSEDTKVLKQILAVLKEQNKQTMVAGRKAESGFGEGLLTGGTGGILRKLLTGGGLGAGGLAGLLALMTTMPGDTNQNVPTDFTKRYAKIETEDGVQYAEMDKKTGAITDILTRQEAEELKILDELGDIKWNKASEKLIQKSILANLDMSRDAYVVSNDLLSEIELNLGKYDSVSKDTLKWAKVARDAQKKIAEELARKANMKIAAGDSSAGEYTTVFGAKKGPMSMDPNAVPIFNLGDQTSNNIEKEVLYSIDTSNVARNVFWGVNK